MSDTDMQWHTHVTAAHPSVEECGRRVVAWIKSLQGEARYVADSTTERYNSIGPLIAVRTINGWRYMKPGDWAVMGLSWFLAYNTESPDSPAWRVRDFKILNHADYVTYKRVNNL